MNILSFVGDIFKPAAKLIDDLHTSEEEKLDAKKKLTELEHKFASKALSYQTELMKKQADIITAEATGQSWLQRNWRPITMMTMLVLIVLEALGLTVKGLPEWFGTLFQIGLGGYVVGRSAEKIAPSIVDAVKKKA